MAVANKDCIWPHSKITPIQLWGGACVSKNIRGACASKMGCLPINCQRILPVRITHGSFAAPSGFFLHPAITHLTCNPFVPTAIPTTHDQSRRPRWSSGGAAGCLSLVFFRARLSLQSTGRINLNLPCELRRLPSILSLSLCLLWRQMLDASSDPQATAKTRVMVQTSNATTAPLWGEQTAPLRSFLLACKQTDGRKILH
jgi:hypothetical protein